MKLALIALALLATTGVVLCSLRLLLRHQRGFLPIANFRFGSSHMG
jgi:hypothetical protein